MSTSTFTVGGQVSASSFIATGSAPGFSGDGSGLTNIPLANLATLTANNVLITNGTGAITTTSHLANNLGGTGIDSSALTGVAKISSGTWSASTINASDITNNTITSSQIASGTINGSNIAPATITGSNIASGTVSGSNIASNTITGSNIASNTIPNSALVTLSTSGLVSNSATTATSSNTANSIVARDGSGNINVGTVTNTQLLQQPSAYANYIVRSAYVQTTNATATTLYSFATSSNNAYTFTITIVAVQTTSSVSGQSNPAGQPNPVNQPNQSGQLNQLGLSASYQFLFKVNNVGGTITISSITNLSSIIDIGLLLTGASVAITSNNTNIIVQVTGTASTTIRWAGAFNIVGLQFSP